MTNAKDAKGKAAQVVEQPPPSEHDKLDCQSEKDLLVPGAYSDNRQNLKSLRDIVQQAPEKLFLVQKSSVVIFRYEDVLFTVYPHLAAHRKRGTNSKEVFLMMDPQVKKEPMKDLTSINQTKAFLLDTQQTVKSVERHSVATGGRSNAVASAMSIKNAANETSRS